MKIFIVDDNHEFCTTIADVISAEGWQYDIANSPTDAIEHLKRDHISIGAMLLDIEFNHATLTGLDVLAYSIKHFPRIPIVMISGVGTIETAVKATQLGAMNFIPKSSIDASKLREVLYSAVERFNIRAATEEIRQVMMNNGLIGNSRPMLAVADNILRYGRTELNVLITGETGTGKKLVAQALHSVSKKAGKNFVTVDIPNIPASLFQSELFGHLKGSYSGATEDKIGLFQQADKGTLFLDEIGDMPLELQANLLLPVEEKSVRRLGSVKTERVDTRFISATDRNLLEAIKSGRFREQLYHRLRECEIHVPPLRERREDIPLIAQFYTEKHNQTMHEDKTLSPAAIEHLQGREWRGNIRELANLLKVVLQTTQADRIEVADICRISPPVTEISGIEMTTVLDGNGSLRDDISMIDRIKITNALERCKGNVSKAAAILNISRETLHARIRKYGIDVHAYRTRE